tara:strand:+ start:238 stop:801 length:564 start_codon:yes stop_codon:yes gene_type:complete
MNLKSKKVTLTCDICKVQFQKLAKEYKRQVKKNTDRTFYCSLSCAGFKNKNSLGKHLGSGTLENFKGRRRERDELTPFRYILRSIERRCKRKGRHNDLSLECLKDLWDKQNGKCTLTGWDLILPKDSSVSGDSKSIYRASVDRIDSSKGYTIENIRFIAVIANYCKNTFSDKDVVLFCKAVANNLKA